MYRTTVAPDQWSAVAWLDRRDRQSLSKVGPVCEGVCLLRIQFELRLIQRYSDAELGLGWVDQDDETDPVNNVGLAIGALSVREPQNVLIDVEMPLETLSKREQSLQKAQKLLRSVFEIETSSCLLETVSDHAHASVHQFVQRPGTEIVNPGVEPVNTVPTSVYCLVWMLECHLIYLLPVDELGSDCREFECVRDLLLIKGAESVIVRWEGEPSYNKIITDGVGRITQ